ncbi:MAG: RluA family pseudouridine synthase [Paludibacter sp.]|nr:RluA family pseudouridine synthase [Paludibacter sp.]
MADEEYIDEFENDDLQSETNDNLFERYRFVVDKGQSMLRIDKYLTDKMANVSRNRIQDAAEAGCIRVNDAVVKSNYRVKPLDLITIFLGTPAVDYHIVAQPIPLNISYEDEDILLINKQAGLVVHPGVGNHDGTLLNALAWHLKDDKNIDLNNPSIGLVHRIDKNTSGLLLIAKTPEAKSYLGKQFYEKTTSRLYQALVWGNVKNNEGTITGDLARDPRDRLQFTVFPEGENPFAKHAVTHYRVIERLGYVTLVECRLETGRTHQIRVHMKHIGHPLFNDERYGGNVILKGTTAAHYKSFIKNCFNTCPRQALHAKTLGFVHPRTKQIMNFECPLPPDMSELISQWREYSNEYLS